MLVWAFFLVLGLSSRALGDVVVYETSLSHRQPTVSQRHARWVEKTRRGGIYVVEVDSYRTNAGASGEKTNVDSEKFLNWAFQLLNYIAAEKSDGKPVYLDVSVVEKKTTTQEKVQGVYDNVAETKAEQGDAGNGGSRRAVWMTLLLVTCFASWFVLIIQVNRLIKRYRRRQQRKLKKTTKRKELTVPFLKHEGP